MDGAVLLVIYRLAQRARHEGGVDGLQRASAIGVFVAVPPRPTRMNKKEKKKKAEAKLRRSNTRFISRLAWKNRRDERR